MLYAVVRPIKYGQEEFVSFDLSKLERSTNKVMVKTTRHEDVLVTIEKMFDNNKGEVYFEAIVAHNPLEKFNVLKKPIRFYPPFGIVPVPLYGSGIIRDDEILDSYLERTALTQDWLDRLMDVSKETHPELYL